MRKIKVFIASLLIWLPLLAPVAVSAQFNPLEQSCEGVSGSEICNEANNTDDPVSGSDGVLLNVANILAIVGGIIAVIIIIVAGITMLVSAGDSNKVSKSRNTIIYAAVGIVIIVLARAFVVFIINRVG